MGKTYYSLVIHASHEKQTTKLTHIIIKKTSQQFASSLRIACTHSEREIVRCVFSAKTNFGHKVHSNNPDTITKRRNENVEQSILTGRNEYQFI